MVPISFFSKGTPRESVTVDISRSRLSIYLDVASNPLVWRRQWQAISPLVSAFATAASPGFWMPASAISARLARCRSWTSQLAWPDVGAERLMVPIGRCSYSDVVSVCLCLSLGMHEWRLDITQKGKLLPELEQTHNENGFLRSSPGRLKLS